MRRCSLFACAGALATLVAACGQEPGSLDGFTSQEWHLIRTLSPLPPLPADPTNMYADNPESATFGQRLFFEKSYAGAINVISDPGHGSLGAVGETGKFSCAACHNPSAWFRDARSVPNSISFAANFQNRNTPALINLSYLAWFNWDGRWDMQWVRGDVENAGSMASDRLKVAHMLYKKYRAEYNALFPVPLDPALDPAAPDAARFPPSGKPKADMTAPDGPWELMAPADRAIVNVILINFLKAIGAYTRQLVSRNAPFDRYVAGDRSAMSADARRGLKLFIGKADCVGCHSTPSFSDGKFHNIGVAQYGEHVPLVDNGRFTAVAALLASPFNSMGMYSDYPAGTKLQGLVQDEADRGRFRTASLRNVAETGPYMHTGQYLTLTHVVEFYNRGGENYGFVGTKDPSLQPLFLSPDEVEDLVAFLKSLTGEPIAQELVTDTAAP